MPTNAAAKGDVLENAVRHIIEAGLDSDPLVKGREFTIESNVRDMSSGVLHEIDLLVMTRPNSEYEAKFIFECKNWKKPVSKNEVMILAKKVDAVRANRGFLVAKSLSKHARQQLALESRVGFIRATEDFLGPLTLRLTDLLYDILPPTVVFTWRVARETNQSEFDPRTLRCTLNGQPMDFIRYIHAQLDEIAEEARKESLHRLQHEGTHWVETGREIVFAPNEFTIDGRDLASVGIPFRAFVTCRRLKLIAKFELEGRGQCYSFEPITGEGLKKPLEIHVVTRFKNPQSQ